MKIAAKIFLFVFLLIIGIPFIVYAQEYGAYRCNLENARVIIPDSNVEKFFEQESESYICTNQDRTNCKRAAKENLRDEIIKQVQVELNSEMVSSIKVKFDDGEESISEDFDSDITTSAFGKVLDSKIECSFISERKERSVYSWIARGGAIVAGGLTFYQFTQKNDALNEAENLEKKASSASLSSNKINYQNQAKDKRDEASKFEQQQNLFLGITIGLVALDLLFLGLDFKEEEDWENVNLVPELDSFTAKLTVVYNYKF